MKKEFLLKRLIIISFYILFTGTSVYPMVSTCVIDPSNSGWIQSDPSTWTTGIYVLGVHCLDTGGKVYEFIATLQKGDPEKMDYIPIGTLTLNSTPTDSNGNAFLVVPLIHEKVDTDTYIHLCPFDDIACQGVNKSLLPSFPGNHLNRALEVDSGCLGLPGCCQVTITIVCCNPPIVLTYCSTSTESQCLGQVSYDPCILIEATWDPNSVCNYCERHCVPTLITLTSFEARGGNGRVTLQWETGTEIDNAGFNVYRSESEKEGYIKINTSLIPAKGSNTLGASYIYVDTEVQNRKTYYYKLEDIDLSGNSTMHGPVSATPRLVNGLMK